jgi:hypothetical protein
VAWSFSSSRFDKQYICANNEYARTKSTDFGLAGRKILMDSEDVAAAYKIWLFTLHHPAHGSQLLTL